MTTIDDLRRVAMEEALYPVEAYLFLYSALDRAQQAVEKPGKHVTGQQLAEGARLLARDLFGPLALMVFGHWNVKQTDDFGRMVFHLVDRGLMGKTDDDRFEDFADVYSFAEAFAFDSLLDELCPATLEGDAPTLDRSVGTAKTR